MPKMGRRSDFSHFHPWRALARLQAQKQKFIHADTVFGASSLKQNDFCAGKAYNAVNPFGLTSILTQHTRKSLALNHIVFDSRLLKKLNNFLFYFC